MGRRSVRVAVLYTGGKDSTYVVHWSYLQDMDVACLVTVYPRPASMLFHHPCIGAAEYSAKALGIELLSTIVKDENEEEEALEELIGRAVNRYDVKGIVAGVLLSDYQRMRIAGIVEEHGLNLYTPLWRINQWKYMEELIHSGFKFIITSVSSYGLSVDLLGKIIDTELWEKLKPIIRKYKLNPAFEGGEAETLVLDAPLYRRRISLRARKVIISRYDGFLEIEDIRLSDRPMIEIH